MKHQVLLAGLGLALALAGSVHAQAPAAAPKPKVNFKDPKVIDKWIVDNKIELRELQARDSMSFNRDWATVGAAPEGVYLARRTIEGAEMNPSNLILVVRLEMFEPIIDGATTITSISFDHELDCVRKESRRVRLTSYAKHNLNGRNGTEKIDEKFQPFKADPLTAAVATDICKSIGR